MLMAVLLITAPWAQNLKQKCITISQLKIKKIKVESVWCVHVSVVHAELRRGCWIPGATWCECLKQTLVLCKSSACPSPLSYL